MDAKILWPWIEGNIVALSSLLIAGISLVVSGISLWYNHFRKCKIEVFVGDKVGIVISSWTDNARIHLNCSFINDSSRNGVIEKIKIELTDPNKRSYQLEWNEFYAFVGNQKVVAESLPFPIAVNANSSVNKGIQFQLPTYTIRQGSSGVVRNDIDWVKGKYDLSIMAWYNKPNLQNKPNMKKNLSFPLTTEDVSALSSCVASQQVAVRYVDVTNNE